MDLVGMAAGLVRRAAVEAYGAQAALRTGVVRPELPHRTLGAGLAFLRLGPLGAAFAAGAARHPDRLAVADGEVRLTFAQLDRRAKAIAATWHAEGLDHTSTIALLCRNHAGFLEALAAGTKIGATVVLANTDFAGPQLRDVCLREGVDLVVCDEELLPTAAEAGVRTQVAEELPRRGPTGPLPTPGRHALAVLLTSGTTGTPKGAARGGGEQGIPDPGPAAALLGVVPWRAGQVTYVAPPLFHALGMATSLLALGLGSTVVTARRFDAHEALAAIERERCTAVVVVPVILRRLLDALEEDPSRYDLSRVRLVFCSGAQLEAALAVRARRLLGDVVYNMYGSTEVAWATIATPKDLREAPGCAGRPPFGTTVRLYDEDGRPVTRRGDVGRIFVGNGFGITSYTGGGGKQVIDGLLSTGDVGHLDADGRLWIDGRDDEMVVSGGENVFPREVEELLAADPRIAEAAVFGVDDPDFGKRLVAVVVRRPDAQLTEGDVQDLVRSQLARYKVPREVRFAAALPRNPAGKVLKRVLAGEATAGEEAAG